MTRGRDHGMQADDYGVLDLIKRAVGHRHTLDDRKRLILVLAAIAVPTAADAIYIAYRCTLSVAAAGSS